MVRNITLSADEALIDRARQRAAKEQRSLNDAFREWLERYSKPEDPIDAYDRLMERLRYVRPGRKFTREEMNER